MKQLLQFGVTKLASFVKAQASLCTPDFKWNRFYES